MDSHDDQASAKTVEEAGVDAAVGSIIAAPTNSNIEPEPSLDWQNEKQKLEKAASKAHRITVIFAYIALFTAVLGMSTGGFTFALLSQIQPILKASWRLVLNAFLLLPPFLYQYYYYFIAKNHQEQEDVDLDGDKSINLRKWLHSAPRLALSGSVLALHFALWSYSVATTSLADAMLFINAASLIIVAKMIVIFALAKIIYCRSTRDPDIENDDTTANQNHLENTTNHNFNDYSYWGLIKQWVNPKFWIPENSLPPTVLEAVGAVVGFLAAAVMILSTKHDNIGTHQVVSAKPVVQEPSLVGDLSAFFGAFAFVIYLDTGRSLRQWMPLFLYMFPVTAVAGIGCGVISLFLEENVTIIGISEYSLFGWLGSQRFFVLTLTASLIAGLMGHLLMNQSLGYVQPLVVAVACLFEPLFGGVMGWIAGVQGIPSIVTVAAGPFLMIGALLVSLGDRNNGITVTSIILSITKHCFPNSENTSSTSCESPGKSPENSVNNVDSTNPEENIGSSTIDIHLDSE